MFNSPFQSDYSSEPSFSFHGGQVPPQQCQQQQAPPVQGGMSYSADDVNKMVNNLRVSIMSNPVKVTEPSYVLTETQMKQLLGLQGMTQPQPQAQTMQPQNPYPQQPQYFQPQPYVNGYAPQQIVQPVNYQQIPQPQKKTFKEQFSEATQAPPPNSNNIIDTLGNVTFGTVGRIGHTLTGVIDNCIDIITFGYGARR